MSETGAGVVREAGVAGDARPIHILSLATLFPDATRPNYGIFVEKSLEALARQPGVTLTVVAPLGIPPWPLSLNERYAALRTLPLEEQWHGLTVLRPRFTLIPKLGARTNAAAIARAVLPIARTMQRGGKLDVIDAQFFYPDGPAAHRLASALHLPFSIKARGSDIARWAHRADTATAIGRAAEAAGGLLAVSAALRAEMVAVGMPGDKIDVHCTGVDAARFRPRDRAAARTEWSVPANAPVLLTVGALIPLKGQSMVIEAMRDLPVDTVYMMAGSGEDSGRLEALAAAQGMSNRVRLLGAVPNAQLASLYSAADLMVLPSASEGLANAWVEALACGTPLVLSDIPPAHEVIDGPDAGRIAAAEPLALAAAIREALALPRDREALAARTRARFDWNRNGAELAAHLRGLVSAP